jgi:hypothetical protein
MDKSFEHMEMAMHHFHHNLCGENPEAMTSMCMSCNYIPFDASP